MTLQSALASIVRSSTYDACKRPSMGGYLFRSDVSTEEGTEGDYTLTFRKRLNSGGNPVDYVYSYDASTGKFTADGDMPDFTGELLDELISDDWVTGTKESFEAGRVPGEDDEW